MVDKGWVSVHRKIMDSWIWHDKPFSRGQAWVDILLQCNHSEAKVLIKGNLIEIKRGQSLNSIKTWAMRFGWSVSKTRHFLNVLQKENMIDLKSEQITTRLSVCNYDTYQDLRIAKESQKNRKRIAKESQKDLNNNENNENNENNPLKAGVENNSRVLSELEEKLNNDKRISSLFLRFSGNRPNPNINEVEIIELHMKLYPYDQLIDIYKRAYHSGFKKLKTLHEALIYQDGILDIKPKENKNGRAYKQFAQPEFDQEIYERELAEIEQRHRAARQ